MPQKYDLVGLHSAEQPIVLYGHFNRFRNFGVEDYYPEIKQFITILRDPFELTISGYFYTRKIGASWIDKTHIPKEDNIEKFIINAKPSMLNHFPKIINSDNYKDVIEEYFIEVGITEHLRDSLQRIAYKLDMPYNDEIFGHHNATERDQYVPSYLKDIFVEKNKLEFDVYNYALAKFMDRERYGIGPS